MKLRYKQNHFYLKLNKDAGCIFISFRLFRCTVIYTGAFTHGFKIAKELTP